MRRETAEALMQIYAGLGDFLNEATAVIAKEPDQAEQQELRRTVGMAMAQLWTELQLPVVTAFPDLHPDENGQND
jgi:hypothetical protein